MRVLGVETAGGACTGSENKDCSDASDVPSSMASTGGGARLGCSVPVTFLLLSLKDCDAGELVDAVCEARNRLAGLAPPRDRVHGGEKTMSGCVALCPTAALDFLPLIKALHDSVVFARVFGGVNLNESPLLGAEADGVLTVAKADVRRGD